MEELNRMSSQFAQGTFILESTIFVDRIKIVSSIKVLLEKIHNKLDILIIAHPE